jgi:hypothetical protein
MELKDRRKIKHFLMYLLTMRRMHYLEYLHYKYVLFLKP